MQIRNATTADAAALSRFMEQSFRDTFAEFNHPEHINQYCAQAYSVEQQRAEIQDVSIITKLIFVEGTLAGYTQSRPGNSFKNCPLSKPMHLDRIYVGKQYLGKGRASSYLMMYSNRRNGCIAMGSGLVSGRTTQERFDFIKTPDLSNVAKPVSCWVMMSKEMC